MKMDYKLEMTVKKYWMTDAGAKALKKALLIVMSIEAIDTMDIDWYADRAEWQMSKHDGCGHVEVSALNTKSRRTEMIKCEPSWFDG